jgi:hypothetical protein
MNGFERARTRRLTDRGSEQSDLAVAAGDRAAAVMANVARWEAAGCVGTDLQPARRPGPARRRLGRWLDRFSVRFQGRSVDIAALSTRSGEAGAP